MLNNTILHLVDIFDVLIGVGYFSISYVLLRVSARRPDYPSILRKMLVLFATFTVSCGFIHFISPFSYTRTNSACGNSNGNSSPPPPPSTPLPPSSDGSTSEPFYLGGVSVGGGESVAEAAVDAFLALLGVAKFITVLTSSVTATLLWVLLPEILNCRSPHQLQVLYEELERHRDNLNETVAVRTAELMREKARWQFLFENSPQIMWLKRPDGVIEFFNEMWYTYTGFQKDGNVDWKRAVHPSDLETYLEFRTTNFEKGIPYAHKLRLKRADGEYRWHHSSGAPIRDPQSQQIIQWCGICVDIHDTEMWTQYATEESNRKSRFLAMVSHEMRTPLNGVLGMTTLLGDTPLEGYQLDILKNVTSCADQLLRLVNNILDYYRLNYSKVCLDVSTFAVRESVEDAFSAVAQQASLKNITVTCNINANVPPKVEGDYVRVRQVMENLLSNAVKFTQEGGEIFLDAEMRVTGEKNFVCVSVRDNGIGISQDDIPKLFQVFSQVDNSYTRTFGGSGLGLALSKSLVDLMLGTMWCESIVGLGSTFYFTFEVPQQPLVISPRPIATKGASISPLPCSPRLLGSSSEMTPRILVVDDTIINQRIVKKMLEGIGYSDIDLACNGAEALSMVALQQQKQKPYDIVFMDLAMPVMDGLTASMRIRELPSPRRPHIIAVTANTFQEDIKSCTEAGMCGHLAKPLKKEHLKACMEQFVCEVFTGLKTCKCKQHT